MSVPQLIQDTSCTDLINIEQFILDHPRQHKVAMMISDVMSPPVFGAAGIMVFAAVLRTFLVWIWAGMFLVLCVGIPTGYVFWLARTGRVSDFHIPIRSQRVKPMILMLAMGILSTLALSRMNPPLLLIGFAALALFILAFLFAVTLKWKISGHATAVTAFCSLLTLLFGGLAGISFLLVPVVLWARLKLRRHTVKQTIAGTALGLTTFGLFLIR
jgi:hypothetical protein